MEEKYKIFSNETALVEEGEAWIAVSLEDAD